MAIVQTTGSGPAVTAPVVAPHLRVVPAGAPCHVTVARDADAADWDAFVSAHAEATGYHAWGWRTVVQRAFGHEAVYLVARRGTDIAGVLPLVQINSLLFGRSLTSLPFVSYGGVAASDEQAARALVDAAAALARERRCGHVELRHVARRFPHLPCRQHKVTMLLRVGDAAWEQLDKKVRNQIRKAQKSGLTSERGGAELLPEFYSVFARNMRDLGTPVYSRRLFDDVLAVFPTRAHVHVVRLTGRPVAAGITFRTGAVLELPWASSIRDYNVLCPNHLLYWGVVDFATGSGCDVVDFGRSTPGEGTFKFKEQWGARPVPLHWEYAWTRQPALPDLQPSSPKWRVAVDLWKRLPLSIANRLGPRVVCGIP